MVWGSGGGRMRCTDADGGAAAAVWRAAFGRLIHFKRRRRTTFPPLPCPTSALPRCPSPPPSRSYLLLFLKFIASVVPTIQYDYTMSVGH